MNDYDNRIKLEKILRSNSMLNKSDFKVGQQMYCVYDDKRDKPEYLTVSKVGRKYVFFGYEHYVYNLEKGYIEMKGYGRRGSLYINEKQYLERKELSYFLNQINNLTRYVNPSNSNRIMTELMNMIEDYTSESKKNVQDKRIKNE